MNERRTAKIITTIGVLLVLLSVALASCASQTDPPPTEAPLTNTPADPTSSPTSPPVVDDRVILTGDPARGGRLYDNWWEAAGVDAPTEDHPLWATQSTNQRSGRDTWRCKECHGWDYKGASGAYSEGSHYTGFIGVIHLSGADPYYILDALKGGANPDHDFSTLLDEQSLIDLALHITKEIWNMDLLINSDGSSTGNVGDGEGKYVNSCADCHGADGTSINFGDEDNPKYLAHLAIDDPWMFIHNFRLRRHGWYTRSLSMFDLADILAYVQTLPTVPTHVVNLGGQVYDKWWAALGLEEPTEDNPLWAAQDTNTRSGKDTWRCKECHGWDYKGVDGAYSSGSHRTGFTGVLAAASMSEEEITAWLTGGMNPDHDFSVMGEEGIAALVGFFQNGMTDPTPYINPDKSSTGIAYRGQDLYRVTCAECHGMDGTNINFGDEDNPVYIGAIATENPWEFIHKVSFGQPGTDMPSSFTGLPSGYAGSWSMEDIADLLAFAQTLPAE